MLEVFLLIFLLCAKPASSSFGDVSFGTEGMNLSDACVTKQTEAEVIEPKAKFAPQKYS